ncbi:hypothetical protein HMPREF1210_03308 [Paenisporosarcina sp. HGH0030]|uniref:bleomycin resistance protein n=1 Tax=Paenisporosarcina sp. HGH0030 TaxID=1078085 RepID=UPI00034E7C3F|nr:VOC family protein [Paenisporosarcina sp. HGH0030]EPD49409.1 hypothetical protein HMPREF1210_03308 [Paenisporosarcina sp. HGH0030]
MSESINFKSLTPLSPAKDIETAITFYEQKLGFTPNGYGGVYRGNIEILFYQTDDTHLGEWTSFRILVDAIESLYREYEKQQVIHQNGSLEAKPWGTKEFSIIDPDGVCITFFERS